ncbi:hypothetical protein PIB30_008626 [Stylosanthes scabra]|uniref:Uncharacterized protein n=1 Tax=Stylosanthes scabra TaxID=79078 RepID=A0ABU6S4E5_9FABA|nr:hypothetical protein [Stylosanthes scabra]
MNGSSYGIIPSSVKSNRTRCSPSNVTKLIVKLSNEQKAIVRDMGFSALENLSIANMSKRMMMELVDCFNIKDNTMRTTDKHRSDE